MKIKLHLGYVFLTVGYMSGIFILSEVPGLSGHGRNDPVFHFLSNLLHIPLFAGLAWCLLMSLSGGQWNQILPRHHYGLIGILAAGYAIADEWHQSFVPGRSASVGDLLLDCLGIVGLVLVHWVRERRRAKRPAIIKNVSVRSRIVEVVRKGV